MRNLGKGAAAVALLLGLSACGVELTDKLPVTETRLTNNGILTVGGAPAGSGSTAEFVSDFNAFRARYSAVFAPDPGTPTTDLPPAGVATYDGFFTADQGDVSTYGRAAMRTDFTNNAVTMTTRDYYEVDSAQNVTGTTTGNLSMSDGTIGATSGIATISGNLRGNAGGVVYNEPVAGVFLGPSGEVINASNGDASVVIIVERQ